MKKEKLPFYKLSREENETLVEGLDVLWLEENIPYFSSEHMEILLNRLNSENYEVYGIECWSSIDFNYYGAHVQELYIEDYGAEIKTWGIDAFARLKDQYSRLMPDPENKCVFNISFGKFDEI